MAKKLYIALCIGCLFTIANPALADSQIAVGLASQSISVQVADDPNLHLQAEHDDIDDKTKQQAALTKDQKGGLLFLLVLELVKSRNVN